ncbi:type I-E CRISPR-associated protein Cse2/CasB [Streptomyces mobaraensis NBRC 13819 = DSM 40847]|uniref:Type I-E CRISPR-associated protein Cse2/CasB n=1 Tax=Streptomyces mobaraensis (strain ATCC 29032 / DSM 40847 / JCM 4168 / NBRC 13819 / NCIMB 11159 / IPCR 16-22) TaxID=1223523 RepID=M3AA58_STRM1|nr:type I-E CRISPR-associated protein Cse2/CasB [Streptomyces mobaraensis]EMF02059.1 hypothetical protein H340_03519 [Streptomyces mobaraensis NBRC 13819 = DSM 40847]QTT76417.1 type I-E CRISPR-associated protein Cse2/CasB [Streptomyces mobaraensis NBRC 13819 = DSM 40847]
MSSAATTGGKRRRPYFWEEVCSGWPSGPAEQGRRGLPAWAEHGLRAVREGLGREPGSVAGMRYLHRVELTDEKRNAERLPRSYEAEHAALTLFGLHQHGAAEPVHRPGIGIGTACHSLRLHLLRETKEMEEVERRRSDQEGGTNGSQSLLFKDTVGRRLFAVSTALDLDELVHHLRSLLPLMRQAGVGLDYTRLHCDLCDWQTPRHGRVLRAWGLQYNAPAPEGAEGAKGKSGSPPAYWAGFDPDRPHAAAELAALRSGLSEEPGTVPAMWAFHRLRMSNELRDRGALTRDLTAEHTALTLFGLHQQGRKRSLHTPGATPGAACRRLLAQDGGPDRVAVERRLGTLLTSLSADELAHHLRGLVPLLRKADIGLDYDGVRQAVRDWDDPYRPDAQSRWRAKWERDFHRESSKV